MGTDNTQPDEIQRLRGASTLAHLLYIADMIIECLQRELKKQEKKKAVFPFYGIVLSALDLLV